ncbi:DNA-binding transcriptional regulator, LysR family [Enhydrobacter aerosaccus]|uniref:DNA-binding transcriptional regulator, LysR family n=1 Tax=Enhydrobacter aerosaccus TaxID=225324 RepID=A0A1T4TJT4_9HYPH|nr:LysR family transcriptional regulator [Enhydrobacter aerosaccus]SKA40531.1 DNA-binding transcriptional regulator, LysR family [Enhydrobacter aerosaccus]
MNIQHLRYFLAVMDTGSISHAAETLGVTQPTLSVALKRIEQEFATRLFVPDGRGIMPLPEAKRLEQRVRPLVNALMDIRRELASNPSPRTRLGIAQSLSEPWASRLVSWCGSRVEIVEGLPDELEKKVAEGSLDIAFTILPTKRKLPQKALFHDAYQLFVGPTHQFVGRPRMLIRELDRQPFVMRLGCEFLGSGRKLLDEARVRVAVVARTRQESTAAALVAAGIGCTIAPDSWARPGLHSIAFADFSMERTVGVAWKSVRYASTANTIGKHLGAMR